MEKEIFTTEIHVKFANPPKAGSTTANVKDADGQYWYMKDFMLPKFHAGTTYRIRYNTSQSKDGRTFNHITGIDGEQTGRSTPPPVTPSPSTPQPATNPPPASHPTPRYTAAGEYTPAPSLRGTPARSVDSRRDKQIATLAMAKPWIEQVPVGDEAGLEHVMLVCMRVYDRTLGAVVVTDPIPF